MKKMVLLFFVSLAMYAQKKDRFTIQVQRISFEVDSLVKSNKDKLKIKIAEIDEMKSKKEINEEEANKKKKEIAVKYAKIIEDNIQIQSKKLKVLVSEKANKKIFNFEDNSNFKNIPCNSDSSSCSFNKNHSKRIRSNIYMAFGLNNALEKGDLSKDFKFFGSHLYDLGLGFKHRITKKPSIYYINYGASVSWRNLRPVNQRYYKDFILQNHEAKLKDSRFRNLELVFPLHFEFDFSKNNIKKNIDGFNTGFKVGIGSYIGFNLNSKQYLESTVDYLEIKEVQKSDFNVNKTNYGVSAFIGYGDFTLFAKYDLNTLFNKGVGHSISAGLRYNFLSFD